MSPRDRTAAVLIAVTLFVAAFAIGSALRWGACLSAALAVACALPYLRSSRGLSSDPYPVSPLLLLLGLATGFTLLQVVPLPAWLVAVLSPARHALAADNAAALGDAMPAALALSMDWPATVVELAKLCGYGMFAYACLRVASGRRRGRRLILSAVALLGAAMALTALAHGLVGATKIFGLYEPKTMNAVPAYPAPLLSRNHFAALMALCTPIAVGLAMAGLGRQRLAWLGLAAFCAGMGLVAGSRGGALGLALGLLVTGALLVVQRRGGTRERTTVPLATTVSIAVVALCGLVLLAAATARGVLSRLAGTSADELLGDVGRGAVWSSARELLGDHLATGIGRGTFEHAFTRVQPAASPTFSHVESSYLQAAVDWGVPAAIILAGALVFVGVVAVRRARATPLEAGALGGLAALALHNTVDFNLELPGVAIPAIAALACLARGEVTRIESAGRRRAVAVRAAAAVAAAAAIALAASPLARQARAETDALRADLSVERAAEVFRRHPSDYLAAGLLAQALFEARDPRAVAAVNRALSLNPRHPDLHLLAARILLASPQPSQALVQYALALEHRGSRNPRPILEELCARFPATEQAVRGLPLSARRFERIYRSLRSMGRRDVALAYARRFVLLNPDHVPALLAVAGAEREAGAPAAAVVAARRAHRLRPEATTAVALARALAAAEDAEAAAATLRGALERTRDPDDQFALGWALGEVQTDAGELDAARATLGALLEATADRDRAARLHRKLSEVERKSGNVHQADWHRQRAAELRK